MRNRIPEKLTKMWENIVSFLSESAAKVNCVYSEPRPILHPSNVENSLVVFV